MKTQIDNCNSLKKHQKVELTTKQRQAGDIKGMIQVDIGNRAIAYVRPGKDPELVKFRYDNRHML